MNTIQSRIAKALKQVICETLNTHLAIHNSLYDDEISVLTHLAQTITKLMNKRFRKLLRSIPYRGNKLERFMNLEVLGVRVFRFFDEEKKLYFNDDDLYDLIMGEYEWTQKYKAVLMESDEESDEC